MPSPHFWRISTYPALQSTESTFAVGGVPRVEISSQFSSGAPFKNLQQRLMRSDFLQARLFSRDFEGCCVAGAHSLFLPHRANLYNSHFPMPSSSAWRDKVWSTALYRVRASGREISIWSRRAPTIGPRRERLPGSCRMFLDASEKARVQRQLEKSSEISNCSIDWLKAEG